MRQKAVAAKTYKYKKIWGRMFKNVHFVIFDNGGGPAEGVVKFLEDLRIPRKLIKTMQSVILGANELCYKKVIGRLAEDTNRIQAAKSRSLLLPLDLIEDTA